MKLKSISLATLIALFASAATSLNSNLLMLSPIKRVLAQSTENKTSVAVRLLDLCRENIKKNQFQAALRGCQQAAMMAQAVGDRSTQAKSLNNLGLAYQNTGNLHQALGDRQWEAGVLGNLGGAYYSLGDYKLAINYLSQGLAIAKAIGDRQWEAGVLGNLGGAYYSLGDYKRAIDYYSQGLAIAKAIGDRQSEVRSLVNLGLAYDSR